MVGLAREAQEGWQHVAPAVSYDECAPWGELLLSGSRVGMQWAQAWAACLHDGQVPAAAALMSVLACASKCGQL